MNSRSVRFLALCALLAATPALAPPAFGEAAPPLVIAEEHGTEPGELRPRYTPVPPEEESWYNAGYMFALTGSVARSTMSPALKAPLFVFTVPLDIVLLPFAAIGGLFG
jgi:hypothetical protein